jgi:uncharacterized protein (TIGR00369 family)
MTTSTPKAQWRSSPPLYHYLGFELDSIGDGAAQVRVPVQTDLSNSRGEVHGGALSAVADAAMSQAVRTLIDVEMGVATMTLVMNFLAPARGEVICKATVRKSGRSVMFAEAEVIGSDGVLACTASASFRILPKSVYHKK